MKNDNQLQRHHIKQFKEELCSEFSCNSNIVALSKKLSVFIDKQLIQLFEKNKLHEKGHFSLLALGSYGRRELLLHSDIDLLLLHSDTTNQAELDNAQHFIQDCWDIGLEVGHQITTVSACAELASTNLSVISSIMDLCLICGSHKLLEELSLQTHSLYIWSSIDYFHAKQDEQNKRYAKYGETAYNLEPNVKYGPGGLRDLQLLESISKRHFGIKSLSEGIPFGFITDKEYEELLYGEHFLWRIRFALHMLAGKAEERLSFDYQLKLAAFFGYKDEAHSLAIEQFMKNYFKVIKRNRELNEMLMQWFNETIVHHQKQSIVHLDEEFQLSNNFIEVRRDKVFTDRPESLFSLFLWLVKNPQIDGVRASTIRLIRQSLYLIGPAFKQSQSATTLFMALLQQANPPYEALQRMNRYGVLAHYLDCFGAVTGQMQYDLFHAYTVDQHSLFVIKNIARFTQSDFAQQFPLCNRIMSTLEKPELLYLSALFHDIAKGRGGDHSELGAIEMQRFAVNHGLDQKDTDLTVWLVRHHLLMSHTAQRQDIYDPKTIEEFCLQLPSPDYLDYLYLLTVADICGTNPSLWNAWKDSLLKELYMSAKKRFQVERGVLDESSIIASKKHYALSLLISQGVDKSKVEALWSDFRDKYFLHESADMIAGHTKAIVNCQTFPLVLIMPHHSLGGTEVFIYMPHRDERFTITTSVLTNQHVTIQEASILSCRNHFDLDTYVILDENNQLISDAERIRSIQNSLQEHLSPGHTLPPVARKRLPRALAHFNVATQISFSDDEKNSQTRLFLIANDRPGLLASISRVFLKEQIHLHNAKISTAGERAEDTFFISNKSGHPLGIEEKERLKQALLKEAVEGEQ